MHVATVLSPVTWANAPLSPGGYFVEDHNAAELLWASRGFGEVALKFREFEPFDPAKIWLPGARVLVVRVGGFGDLLWLNPIYKAMREAGVYVAHCCFDRYASVLNGFVDHVVPYPLSQLTATKYHQIIWLENVIEGKACEGTEHPAARFAKVFNAPEGLPRAGYLFAAGERDTARDIWPRTGKKRVCVQTASSGSAKTYLRIPELLAEISMAGHEILIVGDPRPACEGVPPDVFDCSMKSFSFRQSVAMASWCDAIVAPDSAFVHVGAALGIPVLGLFGPFSGAAYMDGVPGIAMQGRAKCSPCSWHPRGTPFPPGQQCATSGFCNALANVPPGDIAFMLKRILK